MAMLGLFILAVLLPLVAANAPPNLQGCMNRHNSLRANHGASPLSYDLELQRRAQNWANRCVFSHDPNRSQGQNIFVTPEQGGGKDYFKMATDHWYNEEKKYRQEGGYNRPGGANLGDTGHFTQVVWKSTNRVGCAKQHCPVIAGLGGALSRGTIVICNYAVPGNFPNQFRKEVLPPRSVYRKSLAQKMNRLSWSKRRDSESGNQS
ncbi:hypothetical protein HIM_05694 [Hirsutella minnesotensis 3608]|uniref:SCP domain-containing protein n=1 Tax=Hirsutella minnesotensis 3608 TaxID=1043627 RepID=A0A0F7ZUJ3_9HYPO|nr:hypothetical protein HIM_05694 [Hirsutella minnesotensis 3608]